MSYIPTNVKAYRLIASGIVQGVGFRATVKKLAQKHNIVGSVRNLPDGNVEIFVQGNEETVSLFIDAVKKIDRPAKVTDLYQETSANNNDLTSFSIIP